MHRESDHWLKRTNRAIRDELLNPDAPLVPAAVAPIEARVVVAVAAALARTK